MTGKHPYTRFEPSKLHRVIFLAVLLACVFTPCKRVSAGFPLEQPGSRAIALGYSGVSIPDAWSLFYNQAGLGYQEYAWIGVHHENRFITPELSFSALGSIIPVRPGSLGISIKRLGFSQFSQTKLGLAYGMKLMPTLSAGVQLNVHHVYIAGEYGSTAAFTAEGGILYIPFPDLTVGLHILNPTRSKILRDERIPTIVDFGLAYTLGERVLLTVGVEKNIDEKQSFKGGVEYTPLPNLAFRIGMATNPSLMCFGIGYSKGPIQISAAFTRHEYMGYTPHFTAAYQFGGKKKGLPDDSADQ